MSTFVSAVGFDPSCFFNLNLHQGHGGTNSGGGDGGDKAGLMTRGVGWAETIKKQPARGLEMCNDSRMANIVPSERNVYR